MESYKVVLIKQSLPIHFLFAISPPNTIMKQIQDLIVDFFWGLKDNKKGIIGHLDKTCPILTRKGV